MPESDARSVGSVGIRLGCIIGGSCRKYHFCRDKTFATKVCLSQQNLCRDKIMFVATKLFIATKLCLSLQKTCVLLRQKFCPDKNTFVATKMILVVATANDTGWGGGGEGGRGREEKENVTHIILHSQSDFFRLDTVDQRLEFA